MISERRDTETFMLTQASDLENTSYIVIMIGKEDGTFVQHVANFDEISWAFLLGRMEITKHSILTDRVALKPCSAEGELEETEGEDEAGD